MSQSPAELWSGLWAADQPEPSARDRPLALCTFNDKPAKRLEARPPPTKARCSRQLCADTGVVRRPKARFDVKVGRCPAHFDDQPAGRKVPRPQGGHEKISASRSTDPPQRARSRMPHGTLVGVQQVAQPRHRRLELEGARESRTPRATPCVLVHQTVDEDVQGARRPERVDQPGQSRRTRRK
jgi:hypothetical protein